jgi:two-component system response regulator HydG
MPIDHGIVSIAIGTTLKDAEKRIIEATLRHTKGNVSLAAKILGIDRSTMYSKMERHKIR